MVFIKAHVSLMQMSNQPISWQLDDLMNIKPSIRMGKKCDLYRNRLICKGENIQWRFGWRVTVHCKQIMDPPCHAAGSVMVRRIFSWHTLGLKTTANFSFVDDPIRFFMITDTHLVLKSSQNCFLCMTMRSPNSNVLHSLQISIQLGCAGTADSHLDMTIETKYFQLSSTLST